MVVKDWGNVIKSKEKLNLVRVSGEFQLTEFQLARSYCTLNRHSHLMNTELVAMLLVTASVAQFAEPRTRLAGSRV